MTLFLLDFLWWDPPCLLLLFMKRTFLKNHLFLLLICKSIWWKQTTKKKRKKWRHVAFILSSLAASAAWWLNMALNKCGLILSPPLSFSDIWSFYWASIRCYWQVHEQSLGVSFVSSLVIRTDFTKRLCHYVMWRLMCGWKWGRGSL